MVTKQETTNEPTVLIIGIGNAYRGDDAVGLHVAQHLKKQAHDYVHVTEESGEGASLMECWKDADTVILIDAVYSSAKPGTIHRLDAHAQPIPTNFFHYSTHAFGVAEAIELSRALNQLPNCLVVYGIEGKCFGAGVGLSLEVEKAAQEAIRCVQQDVLNYRKKHTITS